MSRVITVVPWHQSPCATSSPENFWLVEPLKFHCQNETRTQFHRFNFTTIGYAWYVRYCGAVQPGLRCPGNQTRVARVSRGRLQPVSQPASQPARPPTSHPTFQALSSSMAPSLPQDVRPNNCDCHRPCRPHHSICTLGPPQATADKLTGHTEPRFTAILHEHPT